MEKNNLTIISVVENDPGLIDLMIESVLRFTSPCPKFIICDNGNGKNEKRIREAFKSNNCSNDIYKIVKNTPKLGGGSNRHGEGLNKIFSMVNTKRTAIVESDCVVLKSGWDYLDFPRYKMLASEKIGIAKQKNYHVCFMVFSTNLLKHNGVIDFRPGKDGNRANRPYKVHEDVGWRIREKIDSKEIKSVKFVDCKSGKGYYFGREFQSDEFWVDGEPIVAHFGRGSNLAGKAVRKGFPTLKKQLEEWKRIAKEIIRGDEDE